MSQAGVEHAATGTITLPLPAAHALPSTKLVAGESAGEPASTVKDGAREGNGGKGWEYTPVKSEADLLNGFDAQVSARDGANDGAASAPKMQQQWAGAAAQDEEWGAFGQEGETRKEAAPGPEEEDWGTFQDGDANCDGEGNSAQEDEDDEDDEEEEEQDPNVVAAELVCKLARSSLGIPCPVFSLIEQAFAHLCPVLPSDLRPAVWSSLCLRCVTRLCLQPPSLHLLLA